MEEIKENKEVTLVDLSDVSEYLDASCFKSFPSAIGYNSIATSTNSHLIINGFTPSIIDELNSSSNSVQNSLSSSLASSSFDTRNVSKDSRNLSQSNFSKSDSTIIQKIVVEYKTQEDKNKGKNRNADDEEEYEDNRKVHLVTWITNNLLCVGFQNGLLLCFDTNGKEIFKFSSASTSCVQAVKVFSPLISSSSTTTSSTTSISSYTGTSSSSSSLNSSNLVSIPYLFILYEDALIVTLPLSEALANRFSQAYGFELKGMDYTYDMILYMQPYVWKDEWEDLDDPISSSSITNTTSTSNFFSLTSSSSSSTTIVTSTTSLGIRLFVVGYNSAIGIYDVDLNKIKLTFDSTTRERTSSSGGGTIKGSIFRFVSSMGGNNSNQNQNQNQNLWTRSSRVTPLVSVYKFSDKKRSIIKASIDPFYSLVALSDSLGRVLLFDLESCNIIRIWKGIRNAGLSWVVDKSNEIRSGDESRRDNNNCNINKENSLRLLIHAPMLGLASIYEMRNGPCLKVIPLGFDVKMLPKFIFNEEELILYTSYFLKICSNTNKINLLSIENSSNKEEDIENLLKLLELEEEENEFLNNIHYVMNLNNKKNSKNKSKAIFNENEILKLLNIHKAPYILCNHVMLQKILLIFSSIENSSTTISSIEEDIDSFSVSSPSDLPPPPPLSSSSSSSSFSTILNQYSFLTLLLSEARIILFLSKQPLDLFFKYVAYLELIELIGMPNSKKIPIKLFLDDENDNENEANKNFVLNSLILSSITSFSHDFYFLLYNLFEIRLKNELKFYENDDKPSKTDENDAKLNKILILNLLSELKKKKKLLEIYNKFIQSTNSINEIILSLFDSTSSSYIRSNSVANSANNSAVNSPITSSALQSSMLGQQQSTLREEISLICKQSTPRSEALCWVMRIIKRYERICISNQKIYNNTLLPNSTISSNIIPQNRTPSSSSASNFIPSKLSISKPNDSFSKANSPTLSPADRKSLSCSNTPNIYTPTVNSLPSTPLQQLVGSSSFTELDSINFSAFCIFFKLNEKEKNSNEEKKDDDDEIDIEINFNAIENIFYSRIYKKANEYSEILATNFYSILLNYSNFISSITSFSSPITFNIHPKVCYDFLSLIFNSLLGDFSFLHQFRTNMRSISLLYSQPTSLRAILTSYLHYLFHLPLDYIAGCILVKSNSTSPLERMIRDHLLKFQSIVSAYNIYLRNIIFNEEKLNEREDKEKKENDNNLNEENEQTEEINEIFYDNSFNEVELLRNEMYNYYIKKNTSNIILYKKFIPSYDEYVSYILSSCYKLIQLSTKLEASMSFIALIREILQNVHDQIERRSYGEDVLTETMKQWKILMRQLRIVLLLKSRTYRNHDVMFPCSIMIPDDWCHLYKGKDLHDEGKIYLMDSSSSSSSSGSSVASSVSSNISSSSTNFIPNYSISQILTGELNIYQILACDTLEFSQRSDQACDHEERCLEVYLKRIKQDEGGASGTRSLSNSSPTPSIDEGNSSSSSSSKGEVLLAWGEVADKRWKDILAVAINEDTITDQTTKNISQTTNTMVKRRRKPLLLFFPQHNVKVWLCTYRCLSLATRWAVQIENVELLAMVCEHLYDLPVEWRGVVAGWIYRTRVLPVVQILLIMEEEDEGLNSTIISKLLPSQLLILMSDLPSLRSFVRLSVELLNYTLEMTSSSKFKSIKNHKQYKEFLKIYTNEYTNYPSFNFKDENEMKKLRKMSEKIDEENELIWPSINIKSFSNFYKSFFLIDENDLNENNDEIIEGNDLSTNTTEIPASTTSTSDSTSIISKTKETKNIWNVNEFLRYQISILWILQLRFQFSMRGVKPSQLLGKSIKDVYLPMLKNWVLTSEIELCKSSKYWLSINWTQVKWSYSSSSSTSSELTDELFTRIHFLDQCCSKMIGSDSQIVVYTVARIWGIEVDMVRLLQLLNRIESFEQLNKDKNQLVELNFDDLVSLYDDPSLLLDLLLNFARIKLGSFLSKIELIPSYGMFISSMDADGLHWAKLALNSYSILNEASNLKSSTTSVTQQSIQLDVSSLRKLLLDIKTTLTTLITTSSHMISSSNSFLASSSIYSENNTELQKSNNVMYSYFRTVLGNTHPLLNSSRYDNWNERLARCTVLISLCQAMMPLSLKKKTTA